MTEFRKYIPLFLGGEGGGGDTTDYLCIENTSGGSITISVTRVKSGTLAVASTVECSKDKHTWTTITLPTVYNGTAEVAQLDAGEKVWLRNDSGAWSIFVSGGSYDYYSFTSSGACKASGNPKSLIDYTDIDNVALSNGCFYSLFKNNTGLTDASELVLDSMTLKTRCYGNMFAYCSSLVSIPELPATTLADGCYYYMFYQCSSLVSIPELPAMTAKKECYYYMFYGTKIVTAPALPATTLEKDCYNSMFYTCSKLVNPPELPATTLAEQCYYSMFMNCTSLVNAPVLPASVLKEKSYYRLFRNCTNLKSVTTYADDISAADCINDWMRSVGDNGTFHNLGTATYQSGNNGIPTTWTEVHT